MDWYVVGPKGDKGDIKEKKGEILDWFFFKVGEQFSTENVIISGRF